VWRWRLTDPALGPGGGACGAVAEVVFPYEGFRPGQRELAEQVREAVESGRVLVVRDGVREDGLDNLRAPLGGGGEGPLRCEDR